MLKRLKNLAASIKRDGLALWFAYRDPRTPIFARLLCIGIVAYALSPIDLIPDFVPILGYLDELILMPLAIWFVLQLIPGEVIGESRQKADDWLRARKPKPRNWLGAAIIVALWILLIWALWSWLGPAPG